MGLSIRQRGIDNERVPKELLTHDKGQRPGLRVRNCNSGEGDRVVTPPERFHCARSRKETTVCVGEHAAWNGWKSRGEALGFRTVVSINVVLGRVCSGTFNRNYNVVVHTSSAIYVIDLGREIWWLVLLG